MAEGDKAWARSHKNGRVALVFLYGSGQFSAGAVPANGAASINGNVAGPLERAQAYADQQSGCKQPCGCPPWEK
jgi:hypothetical protein